MVGSQSISRKAHETDPGDSKARYPKQELGDEGQNKKVQAREKTMPLTNKSSGFSVSRAYQSDFGLKGT